MKADSFDDFARKAQSLIGADRLRTRLTLKYNYKRNLMQVKVTNDKACCGTEFDNKAQVDRVRDLMKGLVNQLANTQEKMKLEAKGKKRKKNRN